MIRGVTTSARDSVISVRNERHGHDPVFFSLSYAEMHWDKWRIHIPDSIADASLLQAETTLTVCELSAL